MRHAAMFVMAVFTAAALCRIELLIDGANDVRHRHHAERTSDAVTATGAAHAIDQLVAAQLAKQLFEVGE